MLETFAKMDRKDFHKRVSASRRGWRKARFRGCGLGLVALATVSAVDAAAQKMMTPEEFDLYTSANSDDNREAVGELLAKGVSPNVPDLKGWTAIHRAASLGAVANLYASLRAGGKLKMNAADRNGDTPLHLAASAGADEFTIKSTSKSAATIRVLLEDDASPDPVNAEGKTPLHRAAISHRGWATGVEALLRAGADPNRADRKGNTPLHAAVMGAMDARIVGALLDGGASTESVNRDRLTPLLLFVRVGTNDGRLAARLLDAGANPDRKFPNGKTPLHVAVDRNTWKVVDALLAANADPCIRDSEGFIPYNAAPEGGRMHQALGRAEGYDRACDKRTGSGVADAQAAEEALGLTREQRRRIQRGLAADGHDPGPADGAFGPRTRTAILGWQKAGTAGSRGEATGYLTRSGADALMASGGGMDAADALSPKCAELPGSYPDTRGNHKFAQCWQELDGQPGCYAYRDHYHSGDSVRGSGDCRGGVLKRGTLTFISGEWSGEGPVVDGKRHGRWVERTNRGNVYEGPYVDGKMHGRWVERYASGSVHEGPYVDGKMHGRWVVRYASGGCKTFKMSAGERVTGSGKKC